MGLFDLIFDSIPHAPGGGLGPGGTMIGGPAAVGGSGPDGDPPPDDEPFFNPKRFYFEGVLSDYHQWLTSGGSTASNAGRTVTAIVGLPLLFMLFHAERGIRSPLL